MFYYSVCYHSDKKLYPAANDMQSVGSIKQKLDEVKVVAATCLGITNPLLTNKRFDICIMDEAGQTTLPVSICNGICQYIIDIFAS